MKILITGGSGFIGTNICTYFLNQKKYEILNFDLNPPKDKKLLHLYKEVDIRDFEPFKAEIVRFDPNYIIHLAARTDLNGKVVEEYNSNTLGTTNLLGILKYIPNLKKVLFTSSMLVCKVGYLPSNQVDYSPSTVYGESKVEMEKQIWQNLPSCDWAIVRPTSIWGPWFGIPYRTFFDMLISKKYFHIGRISCEKTYGYIDNTVYQIEQLLFNDTLDAENKVFYLGDYPPTKIEEWANEIANEIGFKIVRMPLFIVKMLGIVGDVLACFNVNFPMTSFRLKNMTTSNVINLESTYKIAPNPPVTRLEGVRKTLKWLKLQ